MFHFSGRDDCERGDQRGADQRPVRRARAGEGELDCGPGQLPTQVSLRGDIRLQNQRQRENHEKETGEISELQSSIQF